MIYDQIKTLQSFFLSARIPPMSSYLPPTNSDVSAVARQALNPPMHILFSNNPSQYNFYFSAPPAVNFFSVCKFLPPPPPPPVWVYYPLWFVNPNPNRFEFTQQLPSLYSPNPSQELSHPPTSSGRVFARRSFGGGKKVTWRRKIKHETESNGDHITTVMLRNIPNRYTREMMIAYMDEHCEDANKNEEDEGFPLASYDFFYLPVDFKTEMNKGYAFVNFTNAKAVSKFKDACNHKPWCCFHSRKLLEITSARIQGKDELVRHFQHIAYPDEAYSAVCFSPARSGPKNTVQTTIVGKCTEPMGST